MKEDNAPVSNDMTLVPRKSMIVKWFAAFSVVAMMIPFGLNNGSHSVLSTPVAAAVGLLLIALIWRFWATPFLNSQLKLDGTILSNTWPNRAVQIDELEWVQMVGGGRGLSFYLKDKHGAWMEVRMDFYPRHETAQLLRALMPYMLAHGVVHKGKVIQDSGDYIKKYA